MVKPQWTSNPSPKNSLTPRIVPQRNDFKPQAPPHSQKLPFQTQRPPFQSQGYTPNQQTPNNHFRPKPEPMEVDSSRIYRPPSYPQNAAIRRPSTQSMQINNPAPKRHAHNAELPSNLDPDVDKYHEAFVSQMKEELDESIENPTNEDSFLEEPLQWDESHWNTE